MSELDTGEIAAIGFWASLITSSGLAVWGVVRSSTRLLLLSALLSSPFALIMVGYPIARFYLALPGFHLVAAITVQGSQRWVSWMMLALIGAFAIWFLVLRFAA